MRHRSRSGMTLLEVLIALAILASAALAAVGVATQSWSAVRSARDADRTLLDASAFLDAVALWPREDLDRHLGERVQTPWRMRVDRPLPTVYVVTIADSSGQETLLVTSVYRAEPPRAQ